MNAYETVGLGSVCELVMGQSPSSDTYNSDGIGLPFFQGNADFGEEHPTPSTWCSGSKKTARKGDILISVRAPIGAVNTATEECCIGRGVAAIRPDGGLLNAAFLKYHLIAKRSELERAGTGSTFTAIGKKALSELEVRLYGLDDQFEMSRRLDVLSENIRTAREQLTMLDYLVKSRFIEMFGDLSVNDKNWQMTKLSEICDVRDGTHASPKYCKTGYPLMTSKNFSQGFADFSSARLISQDDFEVIDRRSRVDTGDIVMPMIGTIGHPVIIRSNRKFAIKNVALFKMESSQINAACLKALLESDYFSRAVKSSNRGATQKFISLGSIRALPVPIIPEHIQGAFAELVAQVDKLRFDDLSRLFPPHSPPNRKPELRMTGCSGKRPVTSSFPRGVNSTTARIHSFRAPTWRNPSPIWRIQSVRHAHIHDRRLHLERRVQETLVKNCSSTTRWSAEALASRDISPV